MTSGSIPAGRQHQRGAAVFIVMMVVTLLTAVGIFAVRSASLVDVATGYNRQSLQTQFVSDYGVMLTTHELSTEAVTAYVQVAQSGTDECTATEAGDESAVGRPFCYSFKSTELASRFNSTDNSTDGLFADSAVPGGLIDPVNQASDSLDPQLEARFAVEMTEAFQTGNVQGADLTSDTLVPVQVTLTARAFVGPPRANPEACTDAAAAGGIQEVRSHVVIPALPQMAR